MDSQTTNTTETLPATNPSNQANIQSLPIIDVSALVAEHPSEESLKLVAQAIGDACRNWGFFYIINHGVSEDLQERLESISKQFFTLPLEQKSEILISNNDQAWHGYFPLNAQTTGGKPDLKEGLYYGLELAPNDPKLKLPLHSPNQWPTALPELKTVVLEYMAAIKKLAHSVVKGIALSLELPADYFEENYTHDPTCKLSVISYPPDREANKQTNPRWGVGEHTDYGLLTILKQDNSGGLQVKPRNKEWTPAKPIENSFVCNLGDMTQIVTNGLYLSTPHRVQNVYTGKERMSYPFFFEPKWDAEVKPMPLSHLGDINVNAEEFAKQWDKTSPQFVGGKYGDYLLAKIRARYQN